MQAIRDEFMGAESDPSLKVRFEVKTLLYPLDVVFTYTAPDKKEKHLAVELNGSSHYYALERHPLTRT